MIKMMKNKLRGLVLRCLNKQPRSGYGLINQIHEKTGWKPSYGSIYPLLYNLHEEKLVIFKEEGKTKVYSLTKKGKKEIEYMEPIDPEERIRLLDKTYKIIGHMYGMKEDPIIKFFIESFKKGEVPLKGYIKESMAMKRELARLFTSGVEAKYKKEIKELFNEMTERLKKMK